MSTEIVSKEWLDGLLAKLDLLDGTAKHSNQILIHLYHFLVRQKDLALQAQTREFQNSASNPLNKFGKKCFSQHDEDGITIEILRRLGQDHGHYAEFGVGNGMENNTLILAALGWKGFWVGGEDLAFQHATSNTFQYTKAWVTLDNILECYQGGVEFLGNNPDVVSLDFDGNDLYFVEKLLSNGCLPKLFIVEYNAKFPPPVKFQIQYDPAHTWKGDDYFGASVSSFVEVFSKFQYKLICCNQTGANAFFIRGDFAHLFQDIPERIQDIFVGPQYHLYAHHGHPLSIRTVELIMSGESHKL